MSDPQVVVTLRAKRADIERAIAYHEAKAAEARADLAHVNATIHLFEVGDEPRQFPAHMEVSRLFKRGELWKLAQAALAASGKPMTTRELAVYVVAAKGFDEADKALRQAITYRLVQALTMQRRRQAINSEGKLAGVRVWLLPNY